VPTKQFNQAFKRNRDRFPSDFTFQLTAAEFVALNWSQSVTSSTQPSDDPAIESSRSQSATSFRKHRGATYRPWAFTEHGALMAANILRSAQARDRLPCEVTTAGREIRSGCGVRPERRGAWASNA
jgi:hypothetical protein